MENGELRVFQVLSSIEQVLKSYSQDRYNFDDIQRVFIELLQIQVDSQIVFQQLISSQQKIDQLKYTLFSSIMEMSTQKCRLSFQLEKPKRIKYQLNSEVNQEEIAEILRKIAAIKSQAMFVNQQLSIQPFQPISDEKTIEKLKEYSLRKLIKEYLRKSRSFSQGQALTPLCIRLVVLQQSIMLYLQKCMTNLNAILSNNVQQEIQQSENALSDVNVHSVSSLSASIQQYISNQTKETLGVARSSIGKKIALANLEPMIRTDFMLDRQYKLRSSPQENHPIEQKCCLWF